ncbi:MAG: hypothetical protein QXI22_09255 [Sulfolobales archaeon]
MSEKDIERALLEILRTRSRELVEAILNTIETSDDLMLRLASIVSKRLAIPLNVATQSDLKALEGTIRSEIAGLGQRITGLESTLKSEVSRLDQRITGLDQRIAGLDQRVSGLESTLKSEVSKLDQRIAGLDQRIGKVEGELSKVRRTVRDIARTIENITISIEEEARIAVERFLKERGLEISIRPIVLDRRYEFDIYGSRDGFVIVGEAKTKASERLVDRLAKRIEEARKKWPEKFTGNVIMVLYCLKYIGDPKKAEEKGVWLIESSRELTKIPLA